jgi:hypothetical protein
VGAESHRDGSFRKGGAILVLGHSLVPDRPETDFFDGSVNRGEVVRSKFLFAEPRDRFGASVEFSIAAASSHSKAWGGRNGCAGCPRRLG